MTDGESFAEMQQRIAAEHGVVGGTWATVQCGVRDGLKPCGAPIPANEWACRRCTRRIGLERKAS